jgi:adenosylhomocysteine nucleosidase
MKHDSIGIVMAMPEEIRPILRRLGRHRKELAGRFPVYLSQVDGRQITLIESGMGTKKACAATEELISYAKPRILISAGFGGGVRKGLDVGDVVIAGQALALSKGVISDAGALENESMLRYLSESVAGHPFRIQGGTTVTTKDIVPKRKADELLAGKVVNPVLDMETSAVLETASRNGTPLFAVRAISDAAGEELLFSLDEITDQELNIRISKVLVSIAKKPRILFQMLHLAKNAKLAGNNLALVLEQLILRV